MTIRNKFKTFALICLCVLTVRCTFGQETRATIGGKVTDQQGAVIQQAAVTVVAEATQVVQKTITNDAGDWRIRDLLPGRYDLQITVPGFKPAKYDGIDLQVDDEKILDTRMQVGAQTVSVTVEGGTPLIDTSAAVSGTVVTDTEMLEVPSQSDAPTSLVALTPGVTANVGVNGGLYLWGNSGLSNVAVNGTGYANGGGYYGVNYTIDGGTDTNNLGQIAFEPPMDAVGEFRLVTNAYDASMGRNLGSTVDLISKTGGRSVHGDLYESNQNNFLNANTYQYDNSHTPKAPVHLNLYGGSAGGPVWIPKLYDGRKKDTFFFFNWDGIRVVTPVNPGYMSIPTAQERAGDFSSSYTVSSGVQYPINIYDPNTIYQTTPGNFARNEFGSGCGPTPVPSTCNVIPSGRMDPVAKAVYALLPLPDSPAQTSSGNNTNNYVMQELQQDKMAGAGLRLDQAWNNNNHSYLTMRWNQWSELSVDPFGASFWLNGYLQSRENRGITLDHTVLLKDNYLLDLKYNVTNYFYLNQSTANGHNPASLGFSSNYLSQMQTTMVPLLEGFIGNLPNYGLGTEYNGYTGDVNQDLTAGVTHTWKTHNLRFGAEYMIQQEGSSNPGSTGGTFSFGTNWTNASPVGALPTGSGSSLASFFLGLPTSGSNGYVANAFWSQHYTAYYLQDDWRVNNKLTVNVGLRWDYELPVTERLNRMVATFDPNFVVTGVTSVAQPNYATLIGAPAAGNTGLALLQAERPNVSSFVAKGGLLYAGLNGNPRRVLNPLKKYFQPRVGFAYRIFDNTVIRGGLGRFAEADFTTGSQTGYSQYTNMLVTSNNYESAPNISLENPFPNGYQKPIGNSQGELTNIGTVSSFTDPNFGRSYTDAASFSIQQQIQKYLFEAGMTLDETHGLSMGWEINDPSSAIYHAENDPEFTSTGAPVSSLPGNTYVNNPLYQVPGISTSASAYTQQYVTASTLLRPNPVLGNLVDNKATGIVRYYALNTKVERRFQNGFSFIQAFTWSKDLTANNFIGPQSLGAVIQHTLSGNDNKFHYVLTPVYELPFGHGKQFANHVNRATDELIGGWEFTGEYQFISGTPLSLKTNSNFFEGGDPSLGSKKSGTQWFNTSMFRPYPSSSTTVAQLAAYPSWTGVAGLPGASWTPTGGSINNGVFNDFTSYYVTRGQTVWGDVRNPYTTVFSLGARKSFAITESVHVQLGLDAFNALNHPIFGNIDTTPSDSGFGCFSGSCSPSKWVQTNSPRTVQLRGRFTF